MSLREYTAEVKGGLLLELPMEAEELHLKPGDKITVRLEDAAETLPAANQPKQLRGLGAFKGKFGGTEALFQAKQEDIQREERRF